ncbi:hypothetical protein [Algoriphagus namhaensis]
MKQGKSTTLDKIKTKLGLPLLVVSLLFMSFLPLFNANGQDLEEVADTAIKVGQAIDSSCDKKRPEGGFTACKGGTCAPAKCISFRAR